MFNTQIENTVVTCRLMEWNTHTCHTQMLWLTSSRPGIDRLIETAASSGAASTTQTHKTFTTTKEYSSNQHSAKQSTVRVLRMWSIWDPTQACLPSKMHLLRTSSLTCSGSHRLKNSHTVRTTKPARQNSVGTTIKMMWFVANKHRDESRLMDRQTDTQAISSITSSHTTGGNVTERVSLSSTLHPSFAAHSDI